MRIMHTADWHLGKKLNDFNRIEEQREVLEELCKIAQKEKVDAVVIAGDLFDTFNPPNEAIELLYKTVHKLANNGKIPVIAIAGNHDSADRIEAPHPLARECGIIFSGYPDTLVPEFSLETGLKITRSDHGFLELELPASKELLRIIATPYANESRLKAFFGIKDTNTQFRKILKEKWQDLATKYCDDQGVNLLVAHLFMNGKDEQLKEPKDERSIIHVGGAQPVHLEDIPQEIDYTALGHLHRYHNLAGRDLPPVIYSGSLLEYSLSEVNQEKKVVIIDIEVGKKAKVEAIPLKIGKRLYRKKFEQLADALTWLKEHQETYVEITLVSDTFLTAETKRALYDTHQGILAIIPEINRINASNEEEEPKINEDLELLFQQYFEQKHGKPINTELKDLFLEILHQDKDK